jgi:hypothetical protein
MKVLGLYGLAPRMPLEAAEGWLLRTGAESAEVDHAKAASILLVTA